MRRVIFLSLMSVSLVGYSQKQETVEKQNNNKGVVVETLTSNTDYSSDKIYTSVETMPEYPGGIDALREFVAQNYKNPKVSRDIKGNLIVTFIIEPDGSMSNIKVVRDLGFGIGFEAIRVLKLADKWTPGTQDGKPVRVNYTLPIIVKIKATKDK